MSMYGFFLGGGSICECECSCLQRPEASGTPVAGVTGGRQPRSAGNGSWVLGMSSTYTEPLSSLSSPHGNSILNKEISSYSN